jgi:hypothetical protein
VNIKCPYCGCSYEIDSDLLKAPIGNEKLGYGWWLRCYKCQKKWWLKNTDVAMYMDMPLRADKVAKIEKLSRLARKGQPVPKKIYWMKYLFIILIIATIAISYYKRDLFYNYIANKAKHLSEAIVPKLTMKDVKYMLEPIENENKYKIIVTGKIINEDKIVAKFKGIEFSVYDSNNNNIKSWVKNFETDFILVDDSIEFSSTETIEKPIDNIKVNVAIF